jgi:hypothetical protein
MYTRDAGYGCSGCEGALDRVANTLGSKVAEIPANIEDAVIERVSAR